MHSTQQKPVLILGAGINGCALARELVLNGIGVWIVDRHDIGFGATSRSSRLIHGGLRYLEYGDFRLVRESLAERAVLRKVAPQFVEPLRLHIPVARRTGGLLRSAFRFLGAGRSAWLARVSAKFLGDAPRGLWLVCLGLWLYDRFASGHDFPPHSVVPVGTHDSPRVDATAFRWLCAYADAQMRHPERFILALLEDARQIARENNVDFRVFTHHSAIAQDSTIELRGQDPSAAAKFTPRLIVNATGAWGDLTLKSLQSSSPRMFGPTKGSHFVSHAPRFREALGDAGVYAEADDGRLVFVLPFGESVLVGTTDERFEEDPATAVADEREIHYLLGMVNDLFPSLQLTREDVALHYCGVRPLPYAPVGTASAITRDHAVVEGRAAGVSVLTLVGGKLTTARAFAQLVADSVLQKLSAKRTASSSERIVPGGKDYPADRAAIRAQCAQIAAELQFDVPQVQAVWSLVGNRAREILREAGTGLTPFEELPATRSTNGGRANLAGTQLPVYFVKWIIAHEWVATLDDLVERRLMLLFEPGLCAQTICDAAACMVEAGYLLASQQDAAAQATIERLQREHGCRLATTV